MMDVTQNMAESCAYCAKTHEPNGSLIELRPYGKDGAWICFDCGMKPDNKATTEQMFKSVLKENDLVITGDRKDNTKLN